MAFHHVTKAAILDSLYLIKESVTYNATTFYKGALSDSLQPIQYDNAVLTVQGSSNDSIVIMNMDTIDYELYLNTDNNQTWTITAEDTLTIELPLLDWGTHAILSTTTEGKLLGTACILQVDLQADHIYSWDQWDMNNVLSQEIAAGTEISIPATYRPNVFTINADPLAPMDTSNALIHGYVGDTILISVLNSGNMVHNIHFHGYHCTILGASKQSDRVGWSKDSFPVMIGETMTLRLVPDQPGVYPVHNHNLATLLYNNNYPSGMMTMIKIYE
tara:strand:+ start:22668 stop:23489 length:822 start_codon:yes stop_codon:yes gene_type:complete